MPEIRYRRLTGARTRSAFSVAFRSRMSLWLGPDHLLSVDSSGFAETYKRFYFKDIQAITLYQTKRSQWWNVTVGFLALIFIFAVVLVAPAPSAPWKGDDIAGASVLGGIIGLLVLLLLINLLSGPTCKTFLRTAVQIEELPSLCRVRKTRRILAKIHPLILAAQGGELTAAAVSTRMRDRVMSSVGDMPAGVVTDQPNAPSGGGSSVSG